MNAWMMEKIGYERVKEHLREAQKGSLISQAASPRPDLSLYRHGLVWVGKGLTAAGAFFLSQAGDLSQRREQEFAQDQPACVDCPELA